MKEHKVLFEQAETLTDLRYALGISINDLAKEMNLVSGTVARYCCGSSPCNMMKVKAAMKRITIRRYEEVMKWE